MACWAMWWQKADSGWFRRSTDVHITSTQPLWIYNCKRLAQLQRVWIPRLVYLRLGRSEFKWREAISMLTAKWAYSHSCAFWRVRLWSAFHTRSVCDGTTILKARYPGQIPSTTCCGRSWSTRCIWLWVLRLSDRQRRMLHYVHILDMPTRFNWIVRQRLPNDA